MRATSLSIMLIWAYAHYACPSQILAKALFYCFNIIFSSFPYVYTIVLIPAYHFPTPALYLGLYLLQLVI